MSDKLSYLPRLGFARGEGPILPLHNRSSPPIRKKPSEYALSDLSPHPDDGLLSSSPDNDRKAFYSPRRSPSPSFRYSDKVSDTGSSKPKPKQQVLFAGPPPPIATSQMFYRDEEDRDSSPTAPQHLQGSFLARNINSVLFDRTSSSPNIARNRDYDSKPDAVWLNLQRRERALQQELQHLLDAQSAGLAANLEPHTINHPSAPSDASDTGTQSITPTNTTAHTTSSSRTKRHVLFTDQLSSPPHTLTSSGTLVPVRQPRARPLGLRGARTGLGRAMSQLADLKAEEDAQLTSAIGARKRALARLRQWVGRREGIATELRGLEAHNDAEPLGRELRELEGEREVVAAEVKELEERLAGLRRRLKGLDAKVEEVKSRREAGLSGYRGALKEVEGRINGLLSRPGVKPLDGEFFVSLQSGADEDGGLHESPGGAEFLRLRPERRTAEMAKEWWEGEVEILERRKEEVDKEKAALEAGVEVWTEAVKLVTAFETDLRKEMNGAGNATSGNVKGKGREGEPPSPPAPEQTMYAQLDKMRAVMAGLEERLQITEENGWNLLICAIGAELEAFRQAEGMLREALRAAGFDVGDDDGDQGGSTPHIGRSANMGGSRQRLDETAGGGSGKLVDLHDEADAREPESDNEVPPDLLVAPDEGHDDEGHEIASPTLSRESSNEVPPEFLREHHSDEEYPGFGVVA